jgi:hypothetical protein
VGNDSFERRGQQVVRELIYGHMGGGICEVNYLFDDPQQSDFDFRSSPLKDISNAGTLL